MLQAQNKVLDDRILQQVQAAEQWLTSGRDATLPDFAEAMEERRRACMRACLSELDVLSQKFSDGWI